MAATHPTEWSKVQRRITTNPDFALITSRYHAIIAYKKGVEFPHVEMPPLDPAETLTDLEVRQDLREDRDQQSGRSVQQLGRIVTNQAPPEG